MTTINNKLLDYARIARVYAIRNWFKLGLILMLIYLVISRDVSVQVNLKSPGRPVQEQEIPQQESAPAKKRETLTENAQTAEVNTNMMDVWSGVGHTEQLGNMALFNELLAKEDRIVQQFISRFKEVAKAEEKKYGIPASITLAHALLRSQAGKAEELQNANNYFALPCTANWEGATKETRSACLRKYANAWLSFRDHSLFYTTGPHKQLKKIGAKNIKGWAKSIGNSTLHPAHNLEGQLLETIAYFKLEEM